MFHSDFIHTGAKGLQGLVYLGPGPRTLMFSQQYGYSEVDAKEKTWPYRGRVPYFGFVLFDKDTQQQTYSLYNVQQCR